MRCGSEFTKCDPQSPFEGRRPHKIRVIFPSTQRHLPFSLCWHLLWWHNRNGPLICAALAPLQLSHQAAHASLQSTHTSKGPVQLRHGFEAEWWRFITCQLLSPVLNTLCDGTVSVHKCLCCLWLKETLRRCLHWELRKLCFAWNTVLLERMTGRKVMVTKSWVFDRFSPEWTQCHFKVNTWQYLLSATHPNTQV